MRSDNGFHTAPVPVNQESHALAEKKQFVEAFEKLSGLPEAQRTYVTAEMEALQKDYVTDLVARADALWAPVVAGTSCSEAWPQARHGQFGGIRRYADGADDIPINQNLIAGKSHVSLEEIVVSADEKEIVLDGTSYQQCTFNECRLVFRGGPTRLSSCYIGPNCAWQFEDAAAFVLQLLQEAGWQVNPPAQTIPLRNQ